jgi:hypothetical protein
MLRLLTLLAVQLMLQGCFAETPDLLDPHDDIFPAVIDVYSKMIKQVSQECTEHVHNIVVLEYAKYVEGGEPIPDTDLKLDCEGEDVVGCHRAVDGISYVACKPAMFVDDENLCYGHEALHALRYCLSGNADGKYHDDEIGDIKVWQNAGKECDKFDPGDKDSVEWKVCERLWDMS